MNKHTNDNSKQFRENTHWPQPNKPQPDVEAPFATEIDEQRIARKRSDEERNAKESFEDAANIAPTAGSDASGKAVDRSADSTNNGGTAGEDRSH